MNAEGLVPDRGLDAAAHGPAERVAADLDRRMTEAGIRERGWRDRDDIGALMDDLGRLARNDWEGAARLWEKHRPGEVDKPVFLDGDDVAERESNRPQVRAEAQRGTGGRSEGEAPASNNVVPESVSKRFLHHGAKFYYRDKDGAEAFEDKANSVSTQKGTPEVVSAMVTLAQSRGWTSVTVRGSEEFRREAWLQASARGLQVRGYSPRNVDMARLEDIRSEDRRALDRPARDTPAIRSRITEERPAGGSAGTRPGKPDPALSEAQAVAVNALKTLLRARGDSERAVEMTARVVAERLSSDRVHVGQVVDHGRAPHEGKPENGTSYYVRLRGENGERVLWGLDLERAMHAAKAQQGDDIVLSLQRAARAGDRGEALAEPGVARATHRNVWQVDRIDDEREGTRRRLEAVKQGDDATPVVHIYDLNARRWDQTRTAPAPARTRQADRERSQ